jgi:chromosome partitioning protein
MKKIVFLNQKGGVGKTTSALNIGAGLAKLGKKVLLIDFDPQGSLTCSLGIETSQLDKTIYELLKQEVLFEEVVIEKNNISLLPASISLSAFDNDFSHLPEKEFILKRALNTIPNTFDYILIDCPPSLGLLTINALASVEEVIIPVQTEFLALQGLSQLLDTLKVVNKRINKDLKLGGIIGTRFNRRKINKDVVDYLEENFKDKIYKTLIRENIALAEAPSFGVDIYSHSPKSQGAKDYYALCKEIIKQI